MNNRDEIENYFLDLYRKTKNYNFEKFIETVFHYNIQIGNFNKTYSFDLQKNIIDSIGNDLKEIPEIKYWESPGWYNSFIMFSKFFTYYNKIVLDFPIFDYDLNTIFPLIIKYIIYNGITAKVSVHKVIKNPSLTIEVYKIEHAENLIDFFSSNNKINNVIKSRVVPFLIQKNYIGIYREYDPIDFKIFYIKYLYNYFSLCLDEKKVSINGFRDFISRIYRFEKNPNERRMLNFLISYIYAYDNMENYSSLFKHDKDMFFGGLNIEKYNIIMDDKNIDFITRENNRKVEYKTEEYINLIYIMFCNKFVKLDNYIQIYDDFCGIYDNIISNNFENTEIIINSLKNRNMTYIDKKIYVIASGFFAFKKLDIPLDIIYSLTYQLLDKMA